VSADTDGQSGTGDDEFFSDDRTAGVEEAIELPTGSFREFLLDPDDPTVAQYRGERWDVYSAERIAPSFVQDLLAYWRGLYDEPFRGVTNDGVVREGLYHLPAHGTGDPALRIAGEQLLEALDEEERDRFTYPLDAPEWRAWSNPEFVIHRVGLRLEDLDDAKVDAVHALLRASLSAEGYERVTRLMALNGFLGELVELQTVMNDRSYWISMFGEPGDDAPWGWQLFGHHVAVNFLAVGGRHVVAPVFLGAEPAVTDDGAPGVFDEREATAVRLASSLRDDQRTAAVVYASVLDPAMPEGRVHPADERHVAGAFRDNRVVAYEGIRVSDLDAEQRSLLRAVVADFLLLLQEPQREATLEQYDAHIDDTWFAWYGATDGSQPFYLRIQSPVILAELDHHAGVWLGNRRPARFHVHTTLRLPNGNDYGRALVQEWRSRARVSA